MKFHKAVYISGLALIILGSFLPWQREGDPFSYFTYGIRIYPFFLDGGGLLVVALGIIVALLTFNPPKSIPKPHLWNIFFSLCLVLVSTINILKILFVRANSGGVIGAATVESGLIMVAAGSAILFGLSLFDQFYVQRKNISTDNSGFGQTLKGGRRR